MEDRIKSLDFYNNKEMFKKHLGEKSYYLSLKKALIKAYPQKIIAKGATHFICKKRALEYFEKNSWMNKKYPSLKAWIEGNNGDRAGLSYPIGKEMHLQKLYLLLL